MANHNPFKVTALAAAIAAAGAVTPAYALFNYEEGDFKVSLDTNISVGASWRASEVDYRNVGDANAAAAYAAGDNPGNLHHYAGTSSQDNSDLLWKEGSTYSEVVKITADLELNYKNYGAFIRGKTWYDNRIVNGDGVTNKPAYYPQDANGNPLEPAQGDGRSSDILDAFVWGDWWLGDKPLNVRFGKQVISWGEGIFYSNGINTINPIDVNAFLTPGSEIKDALIPLNSLYASLGLMENLSVEAYVLFDWHETELPPCGTFFSTTDLIGHNCSAGFWSSGAEPGTGIPGSTSFVLPRGDTREPDGDGQYGVAVRYFADTIQTEFAGYYIKYHSSLPVTSGHMPDTTAFGGGSLYDTRLAIYTQYVQSAAALYGVDPVAGASLAGKAPLLAGLQLFSAADYFVEYPEDIELLGASFNTTLDMGLPGGATSISGEVSWRRNQPFMIEDASTLAALLGVPSSTCADTGNDCYAKYAPGEYAPGFIRTDYYQAEIAFVHFFDQILGASRWTAILDIAGAYTDLPDRSDILTNSGYNATLNTLYNPESQTIPGAEALAAYGALNVGVLSFNDYMAVLDGAGATSAHLETEYYPTKGAYGYKIRFVGDYPNAFAGVNLRPIINFSHDVYGTTPSPISSFLDNRKALGLAMEAEYLNTYVLKVGYTDFYGAEPYNQLADRDFYSLSLSASF